MTIALTLPPELETRLRERATQCGLSTEEYLLRLVERDSRQPDAAEEMRRIFEEPVPTNPAEILDYWSRTGVHDAAPGGPDSPELALQWRRQQEEERRRTVTQQGGKP